MTKQELEKLWNETLDGWAWQVKEEFIQLLSLMQERKVQSVLEIGCYDGGSAAGFLAIGCHVLSVDIAKRDRIKKLEDSYGTSFRYVDRLKADSILYNHYDMLFIDGDHSYYGCRNDYFTFVPYVKSGGMIVFHDILNNKLHKKQGCEVWKFWEETRGDTYQEFITDGNWGGIGVKFV